MPDKPVATAAKLLQRMNDPAHQVIEKEFFGLFYGDKGTKKSTTALGLAQKLRGDGEIIFAAAGTGFASMDRFPALKQNVRHLRMSDYRELYALSKALRQRVKGYEHFTAIILDDADSWWQDLLHGFAFEKAGLDPENDELPIIDWTWYGPPQQAMLKTFKNFFNTPDLHVIITSAEQGRPIKGEQNGPDRYTPLLGTKVSAGIGHLAHVVGRFESRTVGGKDVTEVQIQPSRYVDAKSRLSNTNEKKVTQIDLVKLASEWIFSDTVEEDLAAPEPQVVAEDVNEGDDDDFSVDDDET